MDKIAILAGSPLFEMLSTEELEFVADLSRPRRFNAGQVIFEEGELGDSLYVIGKGEVEVLRKDATGVPKPLLRKDATGVPKPLATLTAPQFFGEMSLVDKDYRSATVRAVGEVETLYLSAENLTTFRKQHRDGFTFLVVNIARVLSARLREANAKLSGRL